MKNNENKFSIGSIVKYKNKLCIIDEILKDEDVILIVNDTKIKVKLSDIKKHEYKPTYKKSSYYIPSLDSSESKYYVQKNSDGKYIGRFDNYVDKLEESKIFLCIFTTENFIEITENELMIIKKDIIDKFEIFLDNTLLLKEYRFNNTNSRYNFISSDIVLFKDEMKRLLLSRMNIILNEPNNFNIKDCTLNLLSSFKLDIICDYIRKVIIY